LALEERKTMPVLVSPSLERTRLSSQRKMRRRKNILLPFSLKRTLCLVPREEEEDAAVTQSVEEAIIAQSNDDAVLDTVQSDEDVALGARRLESQQLSPPRQHASHGSPSLQFVMLKRTPAVASTSMIAMGASL
jgi:hypothetical protein